MTAHSSSRSARNPHKQWAARLLPAMKRTPATLYVCEHDNPKDDARFAARAFANVSKW